MELRQKIELKRLLVPELRQSLKILTLPLTDLKAITEEELNNNPLLEESQPKNNALKTAASKYNRLPSSGDRLQGPDLDFRLGLLTKKASLQDVLLRQLGMFANTDEELNIGQEIIGNIDENGYLKATLEEITRTLNLTPDKVEKTLKLIQQFDPPGVAGRTVSECLLIQLELANENDPLIRKIVESHLDDLAKKNYSYIAKALKEPMDKVEALIKKILKLDPKPGRNYSAEETYRIIPDIIIDEKDEDWEVTVNNEDIPTLNINKDYLEMLKKSNVDSQTKEFLKNKLANAMELLRAISKRQRTLKKITEIIIETQADAIREGLAHLKPLTFGELAQKIDMHESTVCRAVMNKYVKIPSGIVALKDFFSSHIHDQNGQSVSSVHVKTLIKELIEQEDKKHPLSDLNISNTLLKEKNLNVSRRTVAKYREELKLLSSIYRKER